MNSSSSVSLLNNNSTNSCGRWSAVSSSVSLSSDSPSASVPITSRLAFLNPDRMASFVTEVRARSILPATRWKVAPFRFCCQAALPVRRARLPQVTQDGLKAPVHSGVGRLTAGMGCRLWFSLWSALRSHRPSQVGLLPKFIGRSSIHPFLYDLLFQNDHQWLFLTISHYCKV